MFEILVSISGADEDPGLQGRQLSLPWLVPFTASENRPARLRGLVSRCRVMVRGRRRSRFLMSKILHYHLEHCKLSSEVNEPEGQIRPEVGIQSERLFCRGMTCTKLAAVLLVISESVVHVLRSAFFTQACADLKRTVRFCVCS